MVMASQHLQIRLHLSREKLASFLTTDAAVFFKALLSYIYSCSLLSRELGSTPLLSSGATVTPTGRDREVSAMSKKNQTGLTHVSIMGNMISSSDMLAVEQTAKKSRTSNS